MANRKKAGEPANAPIPMIPDSPENVAEALLRTPPKKPSEWKYLAKSKQRKSHKST